MRLRFVGAIGRPDFLEETVGAQGSATVGAQQLYYSSQQFKNFPDYLQVWPSHGAGSACGKGLGAIPSTTVGYEKQFNPATQFNDQEEFVTYILEDQPEVPKYFSLMKRVNREGPTVLDRPDLPVLLDAEELKNIDSSATFIDLVPSNLFAEHHVPGSLNIPLHMLASWAGWVVDYSNPVYLIGDEAQLPEATRVLRKIGLDTVCGAFSLSTLRESDLATESYDTAKPEELVGPSESGSVQVIDVRSETEWKSGRIAMACHRFLGNLPEPTKEIVCDKPVVTLCRSGARSAIAASILQAAGLSVINLTGGLDAWRIANLPLSASAP